MAEQVKQVDGASTNSAPEEHKLEGEVVTRAETGRIKEKANFKAGKLDGETTLYDESGEKNQKVNLKSGLMNDAMVFLDKGVMVIKLTYEEWTRDRRETTL